MMIFSYCHPLNISVLPHGNIHYKYPKSTVHTSFSPSTSSTTTRKSKKKSGKKIHLLCGSIKCWGVGLRRKGGIDTYPMSHRNFFRDQQNLVVWWPAASISTGKDITVRTNLTGGKTEERAILVSFFFFAFLLSLPFSLLLFMCVCSSLSLRGVLGWLHFGFRHSRQCQMESFTTSEQWLVEKIWRVFR